MPPIELACREERYDDALDLLGEGTIPKKILGHYGQELFTHAERAGREPFCLGCITQGLDVDLPACGRKWLDVAYASQNYHACLYLIDKGIDASHLRFDPTLLCRLADDTRTHTAIAILLRQNIDAESADAYFPVIQTLFKQGAENYFTPSDICHYSVLAINAKKSDIACQLLKINKELHKKLPDGATYLHLACRSGVVAIVTLLLDKGCDINGRDCDGNTPLHIACQVLHPELAVLLAEKGADWSATNTSEQAPVASALALYNNAPAIEEFIEILFIDYPFVHKCLEEHGLEKLFAVLGRDAAHFIATAGPYKALELPLICQSRFLAKNIVTNLSGKEFSTAIDELAKKYSPRALAVVAMAPYSLNREHFTLGVQAGAIPGPASGSSLDEWRLFKSLNFHDRGKPDFFDVIKPPLKYDQLNVKTIRTDLGTMFRRIKNEEAFLGTPDADTRSLTIFYATIRKALLNVFLKLREEKHAPYYKELLNRVFQELMLAMNECGGRYYATAVKLYFAICKGRAAGFDTELYTTLSEYREIIVHTIVDVKQNPNSVHDYNLILKNMGTELGLPGAKEMAAFADRYIGAGVDLEKAKKQFYKRYTPESIIHDWIEPKLKDDLKTQYLQYAQMMMPKDWDATRYDALYALVKKMQEDGAGEDGASEEAIKSALRDRDIWVHSGHSFEEEIEADRKSMFLEKEVHDETNGAIRRSFLLKLCVQLKIMNSIFPEDAKQEKPTSGWFSIVTWIRNRW